MQVALIILGVILLVNFLIAMMSTIYEEIQSNSKEEYRWLVTQEIVQLNYTAWPVPLNLIQFLILVPALCMKLCGLTLADPKQAEKPKSKEDKELNAQLKTSLYSEMTTGYFRETLPEDIYKSSVRYHPKTREEWGNY